MATSGGPPFLSVLFVLYDLFVIYDLFDLADILKLRHPDESDSLNKA